MVTHKPGSASPARGAVPPAIVQRKGAAGGMPAVPAPCGGNAGAGAAVQRKGATGGMPAVPAPCGGNVGAGATVQRKSTAGGPTVPAPCGANVASRALVQRKASTAPPQHAAAGGIVQRKEELTDGEVKQVRQLLRSPHQGLGSSSIHVGNVVAGNDAVIVASANGPLAIGDGSTVHINLATGGILAEGSTVHINRATGNMLAEGSTVHTNRAIDAKAGGGASAAAAAGAGAGAASRGTSGKRPWR